jgi:hypothetical protein
MILYYLYVNNKQEGPFNFDDLKKLAIHTETLVWYEGIDNWQQAGQIAHLQTLFPNHKPSANINPFYPQERKVNNWVLLLIGFLVIFTMSLGFFIYQNNKQAEIQKQIDELNAKINQNLLLDTLPYQTKPATIELE